jgi:hypothetical protein
MIGIDGVPRQLIWPKQFIALETFEASKKHLLQIRLALEKDRIQMPAYAKKV